VFGHDHVTHELESVPCSDLTENLNKGVASAHCPQERETPVATERDEVQVAEAVNALETLRYESGTKSPTLRCAKDGAPATTYSPVKWCDGIMRAVFKVRRE
jgi:hypothetical protein